MYAPDSDFAGTDSFRYTVTDGQATAQGAVTVTVQSDAAPPSLLSAELNQNAGTLTITFNESVDVSAINMAMLSVQEGSRTVSLRGATLSTASDSSSVSIKLDPGQLNAIIPMTSPRLAVGAGAVSDLAGNAISASSRAIGLTGSLPPDPGSSRGGGSAGGGSIGGSSGGGGSRGGGGGGGGAAAPAEFAGLYSVMWDCSEPATTVILDSNLAAEITLIADSESFTPVRDSDQNLDGRTAYTAGAHAGIMLLKVNADDGSSASKTINTLDRCAGQIEYSRYVPGALSSIRPVSAQSLEPPQPAERDFTPAPAAGQSAALEPALAAEQDEIAAADCGPDEVLREGECVRSQAPAADDGGCLIATAAYGTELAPQVQMLRELRDSTLLHTESGSSFMAGFNSLYYEFSPAIADMQRESPAFRDAVKALITPMIHSLSIMPLAGESSEGSVLALGILVIALNLGMYLAAPAAAAIVTARRLGRSRARQRSRQYA